MYTLGIWDRLRTSGPLERLRRSEPYKYHPCHVGCPTFRCRRRDERCW